jgi:uncharacterized protein DUF3800
LPLRGELNTRQRYREEVWILMHGSGSSLQETSSVRLYLDDSGSDDPGTPWATIGGMLINYAAFDSFETQWEDLLARYSIENPLHMKEFGKDGRFADVPNSCRYKLFSEVAELVEAHKVFSIGANINNSDYQKTFSKELRDTIGYYGMCYIMVVLMNHQMAERHDYKPRIPFILDLGNPKKEHIVKAHAEVVYWQKQGTHYYHVGGLHFEDDRDFGILQAADVIAWGVRRRAAGLHFPRAFTPLRRILNKERGHAEADWQSSWMKGLNETLMEQYREMKAYEDEKKKKK